MDQTVLKLQDFNENAEESSENSQQRPKKFVSKRKKRSEILNGRHAVLDKLC